MGAPCSTTTRPASRPRWRRQSRASGRHTRYAARDSSGEWLDGGKNYKVTLPGPIPAARFWSFTVYDNQTRSMLETDQVSAGLDSTFPALKKNADGSATVYFGPKPPAGQEGNWVQTMPGKTWNMCLRLYGPLEAWHNSSGSLATSSWCHEQFAKECTHDS